MDTPRPPNETSPHLARWFERHGRDAWAHLPDLPEHVGSEPALRILEGFVEQACTCQNLTSLQMGRYGVAALPRAWALAQLEGAAARVLEPHDAWTYRRLLELYDLLEAHDLLRRLVAHGHGSDDPAIREAAAEFADER